MLNPVVTVVFANDAFADDFAWYAFAESPAAQFGETKPSTIRHNVVKIASFRHEINLISLVYTALPSNASRIMYELKEHRKLITFGV